MPTLVLVRHGKSDRSAGTPDRDRPLTARGCRQAAEAGRWLGASGIELDLAVVSPAERAAATWSLVAGQLADPPPVESVEAAYTFSGEDLVELVHGLPAAHEAVCLVGHNPALEELLHELAGEWREMPTSCVAVLRWDGSWSAPAAVWLVAHGRPPA